MAVAPAKKPDAKVLPESWNNLHCDCGGDIFMPAIFLKWKHGGGSTESPHGHVCHACGAHVDQAHLIRLLQLRIKRQELKEQEQEVADLEGITEVVAPSPATT